MAEDSVDLEISKLFVAAPDDASGNPCAIYLANAANAGSLGNAIESRFGSVAATFYKALVKIAQSSCGGGGDKSA